MNNQQPPLRPDAGPRPGTGAAHPPTDARRARKRQERQLLALAIGVLVIVGGALIALVYGPRALLTALPCLLAGAGAILLLYLLFLLAERWVNR
jgi:hypothetical protein